MDPSIDKGVDYITILAARAMHVGSGHEDSLILLSIATTSPTTIQAPIRIVLTMASAATKAQSTTLFAKLKTKAPNKVKMCWTSLECHPPANICNRYVLTAAQRTQHGRLFPLPSTYVSIARRIIATSACTSPLCDPRISTVRCL